MERKDTQAEAPSEPKPREVVCVYSHLDEPFYDQLKKSLTLLERAGEIRWLEAVPGDEVAVTWQHMLTHADLILLLLSPDFFVDEQCYQTMHLALQQQTSCQVPVVPILARAVDWQRSACKELAIVPRNKRPIASWTLPDEAFAAISTDLVRLVPDWPPVPSPVSPRIFQARDLPKGYVPRPKVFNQIKASLLTHQRNQTNAITTALRGAGGFGKTTLALALCHDQQIQEAFPDGILWVELGEHPSQPLDVLNGMLHALEPSLSGALTLEEARNGWRIALQARTCLLVIDDIWHAEALFPLLEGGPQCVRLVTTRNDQILPEEAERTWVDAMEPEEALTVLSRALPAEVEQPAYRARLAVLAARLGYWPLLLTLAHGLLADHICYGRTLAKALEVVERAYQDRGVTAFRLDQETARNQTAQASLEVSLRHLEDFMPTHIQARERYHELAVFPEEVEIPLALIQRFWHATGQLEPWETDDVCIRLHRLSLLLTCNLEQGTVRLHDVMRNYLVQHVNANMPVLQARFLAASWQALNLKHWADLAQNESYLWHYLILHLCQAGHLEACQTTLTNLCFLTRKALHMGVSALEADLLLASTMNFTEPVPSFFTSLHRAIVRLSHLLRQVQTEAEMGGLLLSHLGWDTAFITQRSSLEYQLPRPFLTLWHPLPREASSALIRTLYGHADSVWGCAVSPDGHFIVSAANDATLKVWDTVTGAERLTLSGHSAWVRQCAVSPDSRFIVSASGDQTLKVWDATTGVERLTLAGHTDTVESCAVSPDGRFIVSGSHDQTLKVWDATTGAERLTLSGHTDQVHGCAVSPDGRSIVSASYDGTLKVWDTTTGAERLTLSGHTSGLNSCAVSPDGRFIVSGSHDQTLKVWDATTGAERLTLAGHTHWVFGCAVSPDSSFIVSASGDQTLKVWDAATGAERLTLAGHSGAVFGCTVSFDGRLIVSSGGLTLKLWDAATGAEHLTLSGHSGSVLGCTMSVDGRFIASASYDRTLKVWDAYTGYCLLTFPVQGILSSCAFHPDEEHLVACGAGGMYFLRLVV